MITYDQGMDYGFCLRNNEKETDARDIIVSMIMQISLWGIKLTILMIRTHSIS